MPGTRLKLDPPADFSLPRDVCSYGYFLLAPNHWDVETQSLFRVLHLDDEGPTTVRITQGTKQARTRTLKASASVGSGTGTIALTPPVTGNPVFVQCDRSLTKHDQTQAKNHIIRMLRLTEPEDDIAEFHRVDPRWKAQGYGRLFRSPTLFEDVVKTVTSCNVAWPSTINMNLRLCEVLGSKSASNGRAFPTPAKLARTRAPTLRARCRVGYRDQRLIDLAKMFHKGEIDEAWLEDPNTPDDEVFKFLTTLPGIGPYAAGNIMQLLGRYSRLALDTESIRHGKTILGYEGEDKQLLKQLADHYEPFGKHRFRSYWFELWEYYESKRGPAHLWDRETIGKTFTAALLKD